MHTIKLAGEIFRIGARFLLMAFVLGTGVVFADTPRPEMFVPDGQLLTRPVQVYVSNTNLSEGMDILLRLQGNYPEKQIGDLDARTWKPFFMAGGQTWTQMEAGQKVSRQGTFLLFDLQDYPIAGYKSTARVMPVLTWASGTSGAASASLVGPAVYLGNRTMAFVWTAVSVGALVVIIICLCEAKAEEKKKILGVSSLLCGPDNYLSLWRTQLVAWTLAVGSMVFFFGVIQLRVPQIPESLVALMGMSIATGGLSSLATKSQRKFVKAAVKKGEGPDKNHRPQFSDLISAFNIDSGTVVLSVPKAQMLFWTGVILILFVTKSFLTGELWDVPWEMVALTGISQAGYVSDKAVHGKSADPTATS